MRFNEIPSLFLIVFYLFEQWDFLIIDIVLSLQIIIFATSKICSLTGLCVHLDYTYANDDKIDRDISTPN